MKAIIVFLAVWLAASTGAIRAQTVASLYDQVKAAYQAGDHQKTVDLCTQIIRQCSQSYVEAECRYTDVMKNVYLYKGFSEYKLYQETEDLELLTASIQSLQKS